MFVNRTIEMSGIIKDQLQSMSNDDLTYVGFLANFRDRARTDECVSANLYVFVTDSPCKVST